MNGTTYTNRVRGSSSQQPPKLNFLAYVLSKPQLSHSTQRYQHSKETAGLAAISEISDMATLGPFIIQWYKLKE